MFPQVVQVIPRDDHTVYVYFEDGKVVRYDAAPLLSKEVFQPLRNLDVFLNTCTVMNHTLAWDLGGNRDAAQSLDIAPDTLYELERVTEA